MHNLPRIILTIGWMVSFYQWDCVVQIGTSLIYKIFTQFCRAIVVPVRTCQSLQRLRKRGTIVPVLSGIHNNQTNNDFVGFLNSDESNFNSFLNYLKTEFRYRVTTFCSTWNGFPFNAERSL
jgi:hypothetical protein